LHFNFDAESVAGKVPDLSGQGNNGEAVGVQWVAQGHRGGSVRFAPPNQYIRVPNRDSLNPPHLTLAVWIKTSRNGEAWRRVFDKDYTRGFALTIGGGVFDQAAQGKAFFEVDCGPGGSNYGNSHVASDAVVNDGRWHHLVATHDGSEQRLYVDGHLQSRKLSGRGDILPNGHDLTIGLNRVNPKPEGNEVGASFDGLMDEVMIFNRALSAEEVQALFDSQKTAGDGFAPATAEQAKLKEKWRKPLEDARRDFLSTNDRESAEIVGKILDSLEQPGGLSPTALADYARKLENATRALVRRGALESASVMNRPAWEARLEPGPGLDGPSTGLQRRAGGNPGPDGLVLHLSFDTPPQDGSVRDASGAGNHGRITGARWVAAGKQGGACQFSITNLTDCIVIPASDTLDVGRFTVAAWIKTRDSDGFWNLILDKDWRKGFNFFVGGDWQENKTWRGRLGLNVCGKCTCSDDSVADDQWHHVAGTFDGKTQKLYVDGVEQRDKNDQHTGPIPKNNWDLCVGNSVVDYGTGEFLAFDGLIDDVRVYNRALSAEEIKALATATQAGADAATPSAPEATAKPATAERLKQVKSLFDQGLISKEDYDRKVKEILNSL
jgi:hypothetical protein